MYQFPIGVMTDSFRLPFYEALKKAGEVGAKGIQVYTTNGEMAPENLSPEKRAEIRNAVKNEGLVIAALCGDFGKGFGNRDQNPYLIEKSRRVLELACELGCNIVTTHIGVVPSSKTHERYKIMQEACYELSRFADEMQAHFAIETGPEPAHVLKGFLDSLNSRGVAVNLDPANLKMVVDDDPVEAVYTLKDYIVHTHAKDGTMLKKCNPEVIYGILQEEAPSFAPFIETPLGKGSVDYPNYLKALSDIGYKGFLTIEREVGDNPQGDIELAVHFLKEQMEALK